MMKRALLSVLGALIAIGAVSVRARRRPPRAVEVAAPAPTMSSPTGPAEQPPDAADRGGDPLASLAAVERAASESAVAGTPSSIPAIPSIPSFAARPRSGPLERPRT
jgi:hypothetical protein